MRKIRTIKELLEIDIDLLNTNSIFKTDLISDSNDNRNFLLFDLKSKFLKIFNQFQISIFDNKAQHLEFRASNYKSQDIKELIEMIVDEYGTDENNQNVTDWNTLKHMSWWFKNEKHESTYDDYENKDDLYYGIMISGNKSNGIEFSLIDYSSIDKIFNEINWLQQRV
ncbi:hypothetical protein [uncultured Psychroserpens sp.]|uniref:hypothetical protein n=1 Tax=uncultured Psychroserpens sp. TaxID=255436 RepID=UPI0026149464|nr:hypothetical protein [uncultured Psychroserpens sp.]